MKSDPQQLRVLAGRVQELPGDAEVSLPAAFVQGMLEDLTEAREASDALDKFNARLDASLAKPAKPRLVLVNGGEEG